MRRPAPTDAGDIPMVQSAACQGTHRAPASERRTRHHTRQRRRRKGSADFWCAPDAPRREMTRRRSGSLAPKRPQRVCRDKWCRPSWPRICSAARTSRMFPTRAPRYGNRQHPISSALRCVRGTRWYARRCAPLVRGTRGGTSCPLPRATSARPPPHTVMPAARARRSPSARMRSSSSAYSSPSCSAASANSWPRAISGLGLASRKYGTPSGDRRKSMRQ